MMNMKQAAELVLVLADKKGLKDVDVVVERSVALDVEIQEGKVEKVEQSTSLGLGQYLSSSSWPALSREPDRVCFGLIIRE